MTDEVLLNKAASIERCINRAREEYSEGSASFAENESRQDAAILNIQRACQAALAAGHRLIRIYKLGTPQSARDVFNLLENAGLIWPSLADNLKELMKFPNIALREHPTIALPRAINIMENYLADLENFKQLLLKTEAS